MKSFISTEQAKIMDENILAYVRDAEGPDHWHVWGCSACHYVPDRTARTSLYSSMGVVSVVVVVSRKNIYTWTPQGIILMENRHSFLTRTPNDDYD